jgi:hypothetical protein
MLGFGRLAIYDDEFFFGILCPEMAPCCALKCMQSGAVAVSRIRGTSLQCSSRSRDKLSVCLLWQWHPHVVSTFPGYRTSRALQVV